MSEQHDIPARLLPPGVGTPAVWASRRAVPLTGHQPVSKTHELFVGGSMASDDAMHEGRSVDLANPTAYRECLAQLAKWCGEDGRALYWLERISLDRPTVMLRSPKTRIAYFADFRRLPNPAANGRPVFQVPGLRNDPTEALADILSHIGRDHAIRRQLRWTVEPGTLATLKANADGWYLEDPDDLGGCGLYATPGGRHEHRVVPALAGITDPAKVIPTTYAAWCP